MNQNDFLDESIILGIDIPLKNGIVWKPNQYCYLNLKLFFMIQFFTKTSYTNGRVDFRE